MKIKLLPYKSFTATGEYSDGRFCVKLDNIKDIVVFECESMKDLQPLFKETVDDYLQTCKELDKIPGV